MFPKPALKTGVTTKVENIPVGIAWMLLTMFLFTTMDALGKYLTKTYPVNQVVWARFVFHMFWVFVFLRHTFFAAIKSNKLPLQLLRSVLLLSTTTLFFSGVAITPLPTASTIMFLSPIIVTLLAIPLLGESVGVRRWIGVVVGFTGALIIVRPDTAGISIGYVFLIGAAVTNALYQILTRKIRVHDREQTTILYSGMVGAAVCSVTVPWHWVMPTPSAWLLLLIVGLIGCVSHLCLIRAFRYAPASAVTPFTYSALLWAAIYGYVLFNELPDRWTLLGAALIVSSGLYIYYRENFAASGSIMRGSQ